MHCFLGSEGHTYHTKSLPGGWVQLHRLSSASLFWSQEEAAKVAKEAAGEAGKAAGRCGGVLLSQAKNLTQESF